MQRVDVGVVVASALEAVLLAATDKGVAVSASFESDECIVKADPARLQQIVWNLLSNAVKFTPEGGKVKVSVSRLADRLAIGVSDTGQGMEPDFIDRAFDRFQQQDATSTRRHGGLGLGLSIVRQLTQLLGGTVRAESPGPGLGSTFTVCLPTLGAESEESQHPTAGAAPVEGPAPEDARLTDFKVLLIDDAPDGRAVAGYALRAAGAEVLSAGSAVEGLQLFREHAPNAILCDIGMPEHDGYEFIRWVRELERSAGRHTPAAAFTAYARAGDRARALDSGYEAHLVKPIGPAALVDAVVSLVQNELGDTQHAGGQPAQSDG
jgi:CheY-like chemotaxis protein